MLTKRELNWATKYWNSANYIAAASIYLKDNFLLERKLKFEDIKYSLLGHWGTCPGINFIYTHLNLIAKKNNQSFLLVLGPGHGFAAVLANEYLEKSILKYYPEMTHDKKGIGNIIKSFCWPGGFPSHINPGVPGCIHEGGELGYSLATSFGAAFDNPDLIVAAIVGDGEAETAPLAGAWQSNKFLNPERDGAVLPIVHLNGYKINSPSIYSTMSEQELDSLFRGYGYQVRFVGVKHQDMADAMEWAHKEIRKIQEKARKNGLSENPKWPMLILKTPKGWTGVKKLGEEKIEGNWRSHQVPVKDVKTNIKSLKLLEKWLKSYNPKKLFPNGTIPDDILEFVPEGDLRIGMNPHANGGNVLKPLILPNPEEFEIHFKKRGNEFAASTPTLGKYLKRVFELNQENKNFRIMSPDELASNRLQDVLDVTGRAYVWKVKPDEVKDSKLDKNGRVMEILSEHTLQAWIEGYILTGRHGLFPSYEAFLPIVDSMVSQYLKFIQTSTEVPWRVPVASLNYLVSSVCWRQDHNGFSHQNPGFVTNLLNKAKEEKLVRIYLPADANMLLVYSKKALESTNKVNAIVSDKQLIRQWLSYQEATKQAEMGAAIWEFASDKNPDVILAGCGDYQTQEMLAAIKLLKTQLPDIKLRFVNVSELNVLGISQLYPNGLDAKKFNELFTEDKHVVFSYHGYPSNVKQLLFDRPNTLRFHVHGYTERGTTTTPFDLLLKNGVSRYHIAISAIKHAQKTNPKVAKKASGIIAKMEEAIEEHKNYIIKNGKDPEEINEWEW